MSREKPTQRTREQALVDAWESKRAPRKFPTAVWARWSDDETPGVTRDSLRTLLGRWRAGRATLEEHPGLRKAIVSVLSEERPVTEADLFGARQGARPPGSFPFRAFPALGAFDPAADEPFRVATLHQVRGPRRVIYADGPARAIDLLDLPAIGGRVWATVPPGAGRSFAANQARHPPRPTLSFFGRPLPPPVVLSLRTPSLEALDGIEEGASVLIELEAVGDQLDPFIERLSTRRGICAVLAPFDPVLSEEMFVGFVWRVNASWRDGFVRWVARRLESLGNKGSRLSVDDFLAWAARIDPDVTRFATPGDLLPLLDYAHTHGTETLSKQFGAELVRSVLTATIERVGGTTLRDRWLRELGVETFRRMLRSWWRTPTLRWGADPTREGWAGLVPAEAAPTTTEAGEQVRVIAKKLKNARLSKADRTKLVEELNEILPEDVPAREVVRALVEAEVLRDIGADALGVSPPWMVEAMAKTSVEQSLAKDAPHVWGRWCVDPARRPFVEAQLFARDDAQLTALITRAVGTFDVASLGAVAAVEALFAVVGDRLARAPGFATKRGPLLKRLASLQVQLLAPHYPSPNDFPAPRTRAGPLEPLRGGAEFVAASWAWSLRVEVPCQLPPEVAWLFPGWLSPSLDHIPRAVIFHDPGRVEGPGTDAEARGVEHMRALLPEVLERATGAFTRPDLAPQIPRNFAEAAIPLALRRGWSLALLVKQFRVPSLAESSRVARRIEALPGEERAQTIEALWETVLGDRKRLIKALGYFEPTDDVLREFPRSALTALLQGQYPVEKIEAAVAATKHWDAQMGERLLRMTPTEHRPCVARALAKTLVAQVHAVIDILKAFGPELADVLVEEATVPERRENWLVTQAVWEVAPEIARDRARQDYALGKIDPWIKGMPEAHLGELVAVVEEHPSQPVPDTLRFWLSRKLVEVGPQADRVWALLQRAGWPTPLEPSRPA